MRDSNTGIGYSDAMAVSAYVAFAGYTPDVFTTPLVITGTTPGTRDLFHTVTTPALAGLYDVSVGFFLTGSSANTQLGADVELDGVPLGTILTATAVTGGGFLLTADIPQSWAPGVHTIEYFAWQPSSPGALTAVTAATTYERKA